MKKATTTSVYGLVNSEDSADQVISRLLEEGFSQGEISVITREGKGTFRNESYRNFEQNEFGSVEDELEISNAEYTRNPQPSSQKEKTSPSKGKSSSNTGKSSSNDTLTSLLSLGLSDREAKKFETELNKGRAFISISARDSEKIDLAKSVLKEEGVKEISSTAEKAMIR